MEGKYKTEGLHEEGINGMMQGKSKRKCSMNRDDGKIFLQVIIDKIKRQLEQINSSIREGEKDIAQMHEYYWENYTEMDQYGYEDYDNQQALLSRVQANQESIRQRSRLKKMAASPFFGRVDFLYEDEEEEESFYIGIANFSEGPGSVPLIYDWRAPVSSLFYDFDRGKAFYETPSGTLEGEITSKWQYKIRDGKMIYGFESDIKIDDEILRQELGTSGDVQLKNIVSTIQREQNSIIRNTKDRILVIQGAAGSGKTSVALHRVAYLLYHDRKNLKSSDVLVLSPNGVFSGYISHILPELGEENIQEMSFDLFAYQELRDTVADCQDRYERLELELRGWNTEDAKGGENKQSKVFLGQAEAFFAELEDRLMNFKNVEFRGFVLPEEKIIKLFYFKFQEIPILSRMEEVIEYFTDQYETLRQRTLSDEDREVVRRKFMALYATRDLYEIYNWFLEEWGYEKLPEVPYEKRYLEYEDVYPMLYLKYRLQGRKKGRPVKHLVIDEMQDYTYLQYVILSQIFPCSMTILGDRAQTMEEESRDVLRFLPQIFGKETRKIEMKKSYRNTAEIAEYASRLTGAADVEFFERHGKPVEEKGFARISQAVEEAVQHLLPREKDYETAAILAMTEEEAEEAYKCLQAMGIPASYVHKDSSSFKRGITVTTFYLAKGLEFDQVAALCRMKKTPLLRQAEYICATRALHELYMYTLADEAG